MTRLVAFVAVSAATVTLVGVVTLPRGWAAVVALIALGALLAASRRASEAGATALARAPVAEDPPALAPTRELAELLDRLGEGVLLVDAEEQILLANEEAARILGREREEIEGTSLIRASLGYELLQVLRCCARRAAR